MNENGKRRAQDKINNKQKSVVKKKDAYYDIINNYLQKIYDQRCKWLILREEAIEKLQCIQEVTHKWKNDFNVIDTLLEENIQDYNMAK